MLMKPPMSSFLARNCDMLGDSGENVEIVRLEFAIVR